MITFVAITASGRHGRDDLRGHLVRADDIDAAAALAISTCAPDRFVVGVVQETFWLDLSQARVDASLAGAQS